MSDNHRESTSWERLLAQSKDSRAARFVYQPDEKLLPDPLSLALAVEMGRFERTTEGNTATPHAVRLAARKEQT